MLERTQKLPAVQIFGDVAACARLLLNREIGNMSIQAIFLLVIMAILC